MKDIANKELYKGDIVRVHYKIPLYQRTDKHTTEMVGKITKVQNIKTGYGMGGYIVVQFPFGTDKLNSTRSNVEKLSDSEALIWKLEND